MIKPQDSVFFESWQVEKLHINCALFVDNLRSIPAQGSGAASSQVLNDFGAEKIFFSVRQQTFF
jgi:hypothetical protein